jgi:hypothetical protein
LFTNARWTQSRRTHLWVTLLLLPALACRMLVPPGFMPGTGADHAPTMQMCRGAGPLPILDGPATPDAVPSQPETAVFQRTQHRANAPRAPPVIVRPA